jgi:hypothetical protein
MKAKKYFKGQIDLKPEGHDTFTVLGFKEEGGVLKFAVDINNLTEFYNRIDSQYEIISYHKDTSVPLLKERTGERSLRRI